jgi:hypothetical protein
MNMKKILFHVLFAAVTSSLTVHAMNKNTQDHPAFTQIKQPVDLINNLDELLNDFDTQRNTDLRNQVKEISGDLHREEQERIIANFFEKVKKHITQK